MGYFDNKENVEDYVAMVAGFDGRRLIKRLREHLAPRSTVLELGMGPGVDLDILEDTFTATGSDLSKLFLDRYREQKRNANLMLLDAVTIHTDRTFDGIYSNKVLHHLTEDELHKSLARQVQVLNPGGLIMHAFWHGTEKSEMQGLLFNYYLEDELSAIIGQHFDIIEMQCYREDDVDDSVYVVAALPEEAGDQAGDNDVPKH